MYMYIRIHLHMYIHIGRYALEGQAQVQLDVKAVAVVLHLLDYLADLRMNATGLPVPKEPNSPPLSKEYVSNHEVIFNMI